METHHASVRASACSKVLITGAYLIIDPRYQGLVLATDARFHTTSRIVAGDSVVKVTSKQFRQSLVYRVRSREGVTCLTEGASPFLTKCITYLAMVAGDRLAGKSLEIELVGDNAFYS